MDLDQLTNMNPEEVQNYIAKLQGELAGKEESPESAPAEPEHPDGAVTVERVDPAPTERADPATPASQDLMAQGATFLAGLGGVGDTMGALTEAVDADSGGAASLFPVFTQVSGTSGGAGAFQRGFGASRDDDVPEGTKPFVGVYLGYRMRANVWPSGYSEGEKKAPVFSSVVPAHDRKAAGAMTRAAKAVQYTKKEDKDKFDVGAGGPGHCRPQLEVLVYDPVGDQLLVFQTCAHYSAFADTRDQLIACATEDKNGTKQMLPFVGKFTPTSSRRVLKSGREVVHHYVDIESLPIQDRRCREVFEAWQKFRASAAADTGLMDKINKWYNGGDAPFADSHLTALENAANM